MRDFRNREVSVSQISDPYNSVAINTKILAHKNTKCSLQDF